VGTGTEKRASDHADTGVVSAAHAERTEGAGYSDAHQNAEASKTSSIEVTPEEIAAVEDYVKKTLGPAVAVEFAKVLRDPKTGKVANKLFVIFCLVFFIKI